MSHLRGRDVSIWLRAVHVASRMPGAYAAQQYLAYPTTQRFRTLLGRHVHVGPRQRVLDLGCGIGAYREALGGDYCGADINPAYIEAARRKHVGRFDVMDCTDLQYADGEFDHVVSIAATHHLDDRQLEATIRGAIRVCRRDGFVHVFDAVLPDSSEARFKRFWFALDAGRFPRSRVSLRSALSAHGTLDCEDFIAGPLHDCAYFRIAI